MSCKKHVDNETGYDLKRFQHRGAAQLVVAADSKSAIRGFESHRHGQKYGGIQDEDDLEKSG